MILTKTNLEKKEKIIFFKIGGGGGGGGRKRGKEKKRKEKNTRYIYQVHDIYIELLFSATNFFYWFNPAPVPTQPYWRGGAHFCLDLSKNLPIQLSSSIPLIIILYTASYFY